LLFVEILLLIGDIQDERDFFTSESPFPDVGEGVR
jgi:hypothetical protein